MHEARQENKFLKTQLSDVNKELKKKKDYYYSKAKQEVNSKLINLEKELKNCKLELVLQKENIEQEFLKEKENYERTIDNLELNLKKQKKIFDQALQQSQEKFSKNLDILQKKLSDKGNGLSELEKENAKLRFEASKYQSALGVATNTRLGDDDQNHSVRLKQDILILQKSLENYVTHLKPNVDIDIEKIQTLAQEYGCLNEINVENKPFIKAILQRKVLDQVTFLSSILSDHRDIDVSLELYIDLKTQELTNLINIFSKHRVGTDKVTGVAAIKIRQEVYGILGNRGFNDAICFDADGTSKTFTHGFIIFASRELNNMMNQYRIINDVARKEQVEAMAPKLIQDIYKLMWFRFNVQEPIVNLHYFEKNDKIDPNVMKGNWNDDDDDINQLRVGICYFPLIGRDLTSSNRKVYTLANVISTSYNQFG
ncbi:15211_t:CDS:1 [Funneliformis mosseae]|uniref:15211_t:CDS:1 n=1 Tax=Funneliformis mosseae TaxID=27381 RepID=A0A9N9CQZ1_FUNMO|nr:15211_t:CDS:1 [Funneliformis mosseae]